VEIILKHEIDINCDLGESYGSFRIGHDAEIMPHITSANIACGFHAGDPVTMARTVTLAQKHGVAVGAHPGFPDLLGFGRREMQLSHEELENYMIYQVSALQGFAKACGANLQHVKLHGALYNMVAEDEGLSKAIIAAAQALDGSLIIFAPPKSALARTATRAKLSVASEFFADRAYNTDGSLVSREKANSVIQDPQKVIERAVAAATDGTVSSVNGRIVNLGKVHTVCVHGDNPAALKLAEALHKGLVSAGIEVKPVGSFI
jgi:UPF0271 protein